MVPNLKRVDLDEGSHGRPAPSFRLRSRDGQLIALTDYKSRTNLVLFFANDLPEPALQQPLEGFATRRPQYYAQNAEVLAILLASMAALASSEGASAPSAPRLLADPDGSTHRNYRALLPGQLEPGEAMLFILDCFGAPHVAFLTREPADRVLHDRLLGWLKGIELECPE